MDKKKKLKPNIPPNALYCPICNAKAETISHVIAEIRNEIKLSKQCNACGSKWIVKYNIIPVKIENLEEKVIYEDIPLN